MSRYYRFRSAERLLGRPATEHAEARPGELDELTIYFASPEELNDPLEGHRETYFQGDYIAWQNLIKHYVVILYSMVIDRYAGGNEGEIIIDLRPNNFPETSQKYLLQAISTINECKQITAYIEALANTGRDVSRFELSVHLSTLHSCILSFIFEILETELDIYEAPIYKNTRENFLAYASIRASEISRQGKSPNHDEYKEIKSRIKQQALRANILRETELDKGATRLFVNFPDEFCQHLEYLMYPHWYVACFMKSCANSAIWGSYGDNHKGICLIYDSKIQHNLDHLTLKDLPFDFVRNYNHGKTKNEYFLTMPLSLPLAEVTYSPIYSKPNFFDSLLAVDKDWAFSYWYTDQNGATSKNAASLHLKPSEHWPLHRAQYMKSCTTKTQHWESETESRLILAGMKFTREERTVKYAFPQLHGIIFGINTPDETKVKIIKKIGIHCKQQRRSDFKFYQARFDETYTHIEHDLLEYITFNKDGTLNSEP